MTPDYYEYVLAESGYCYDCACGNHVKVQNNSVPECCGTPMKFLFLGGPTVSNIVED